MFYSSYFLWAGLILLIMEGIFLLCQRKLKDKSTKFFSKAVIRGIIICVLGIALAEMRGHADYFNETIYMLLLSVRYIIQTIVPFDFFMLTVSFICPSPKILKKYYTIGMLPILLSIFLNILNIKYHFIAYVDANNNYCQGPYGHLYFLLNGLLFLLVINFAYNNLKTIGKNKALAVIEACLISISGIVIQYIFSFQFFFGFALALSLFVLHLFLYNPNIYLDGPSRCFNIDYFKTYIKEKYVYSTVESIVVVDFYQVDRIRMVYSKGTTKELLPLAVGKLREAAQSKELFRLDSKGYAIYFNNKQAARAAAELIRDTFSTDIFVKEQNVHCPVAVLVIEDASLFGSVNSLTSYMDFMRDKADLSGSSVIAYTDKVLIDKFEYYQHVEKYLETAVKEDLFDVWYQPIYSLKEDKFISLEALSRLKHPDLGWISPEIFIDIATKNGLILQMMPLQVRRICRFVKNNIDIFDNIQHVKINLSPAELLDFTHCDMLIGIIAEYNLPYNLFQIEVTESMATDYSDELNDYIEKIRRKGIGVCLDDFCSGYATISAIMKLHFDTVKIDKSMITNIQDGKRSAIFYKNIVHILKELGYHTLSEGVETKEEADLLRTWDVDMIQGYYYSKPLPAKELCDLLSR